MTPSLSSLKRIIPAATLFLMMAAGSSGAFAATPSSENTASLSPQTILSTMQSKVQSESLRDTIQRVCGNELHCTTSSDVDVAEHTSDGTVLYNEAAMEKISPGGREFILMHEHGHADQGLDYGDMQLLHSPEMQAALKHWEAKPLDTSLDFKGRMEQRNFKNIDHISEFTPQEKNLLTQYAKISQSAETQADTAAVQSEVCRGQTSEQTLKNAEYGFLSSTTIIAGAIGNIDNRNEYITQNVNGSFESIDHPNDAARIKNVSQVLNAMSSLRQKGVDVCSHDATNEQWRERNLTNNTDYANTPVFNIDPPQALSILRARAEGKTTPSVAPKT